MSRKKTDPRIPRFYRAVTPAERAETAAMLRDYMQRREGSSTSPESRAGRVEQLLLAFEPPKTHH